MADPLKPTTSPLTAGRNPVIPAVAFDAGLRTYMLAVYNYMASGLLLTGIVAMLVANSAGVRAVFFAASGTPTLLGWIAVFAPLALVFTLSVGINRLSEPTVKALFWTYAILMGVSLSTILLAYTGVSVARTFFVTAAAFGGLSLWGYTTKRNLSAFGTFLIMGVVGLLIAMIVNMFLRSSTLDLIVSAIGVLLFAGLTAFDTQKIKSVYFDVAGTEFRGKAVVMGALTLYLDFLNLFLFLLRFMGDRRQ
ncbi:FtsH-binding integral membrane protein [Sphingomonas sp. BE270]|jgi:FtsH-binding integral membrane protein|uniref:Bax inhibitor-1/YccA family protein n=3 Tax=Alphaproteobacteria TaxID=28211 RepID=A0A418YLK2_9SPHN|nr:FtsH-binding integral membrane protein [Sphingomonas sp. BE270]RJG52003.1 Bax inhibitor-1/YccA family protein [Sphingobium terrigena]